MDSVAVVQYFDGNRSLLVNNRFTMGGTGAATAERRHADLPLLLHPNPRRALFLGLGTGITFAAAGAHPKLQADGVELVPEIVQSLHWFAPQNQLPNDPGRFQIFTADARRYVRVCSNTYDVIVADLFHPARDGAGALYSVEHFRAIRDRLAPAGLFCQWLPLYQLDEETLGAIVRTFQEVFPNARAFLLRFNVDMPVIGLIGTLELAKYPPTFFSERLAGTAPALADQLNAEQLRDELYLFGCFMAGPDALRRFAQGSALNTDDRPVVLFSAPRLGAGEADHAAARLFRFLEAYSSDPKELFDLSSEKSAVLVRELQEFIAARNVYLKGLAAQAEGDANRAIDAFVESARRSHRFSTGYAQCLTLAMQRAKSDPNGARRILERLVEAQPERPVAAQLLERLSRPE
jgi:spermidine synthase